MILICISLMPNQVEHFFICLVALFFSVKCPIKSFASFSFGLPAFFLLVCRYSFFFFFFLIFIWLHQVLFASLGTFALPCIMQDLKVQHVGSSFLTRD